MHDICHFCNLTPNLRICLEICFCFFSFMWLCIIIKYMYKILQYRILRISENQLHDFIFLFSLLEFIIGKYLKLLELLKKQHKKWKNDVAAHFYWRCQVVRVVQSLHLHLWEVHCISLMENHLLVMVTMLILKVFVGKQITPYPIMWVYLTRDHKITSIKSIPVYWIVVYYLCFTIKDNHWQHLEHDNYIVCTWFYISHICI